MKDLQPNILDDYEHLITRAIERWGEEEDFPVLEGLERKALDDYLFEYQRILDKREVRKLNSLNTESSRSFLSSCSVLFLRACSHGVNTRS